MELEVEEDALIIPLELLRWAVSDSGGIKLGKKKVYLSMFFCSRVGSVCSGVHQRNILQQEEPQTTQIKRRIVRGGNSLNLEQSS